MFCEKCGIKLPEGAKFCGGCGEKVELVQPVYAGVEEQAPVRSAQQPIINSPVQAPPRQPVFNSPIQAPPQQPVFNQPVQAPPRQPVYSAQLQQETAVLGVGQYIGMFLLMCVPILNIILLFKWSFAGSVNFNKKNFARASLILCAVMLIFWIIVGGVIMSSMDSILRSM